MSIRIPGLAFALSLGALSVIFAQDRRLAIAASSERRIALVIGNNAYPKAPLKNGVNDARAMADALRDSGFEVSLATDTTLRNLDRAVTRFASSVRPGDIAFFYYSGHGVQIDQENFLVPVDFDAEDEIDAKFDAYSAIRVHDRISAAGSRLTVIVLDACRDNPFRGSRAAGGGLAAMNTARGSFVALATSPGRTASDNPGDTNGLYTKYLVQQLREPGLKLQDVFARAAEAVDRASGGRQLPWSASSVIGEFYFRSASAGAAPTVPVAAPVHALPKPAGGAQLDLSDLAKRAEAEKEWADYQSRMSAAFQSAEQFERQTTSAVLKATAWERFASAYAQDNPLSAEDDRLRDDATVRAQLWNDAVAVAAESHKGEPVQSARPTPAPRIPSSPPRASPPRVGTSRAPDYTVKCTHKIWQRPGGHLTLNAAGVQFVELKIDKGSRRAVPGDETAVSLPWAALKQACARGDDAFFEALSGKTYTFQPLGGGLGERKVGDQVVRVLLDSKASGFEPLASVRVELKCK